MKQQRSSFLDVKTGVPQGYTLVPLLLILYVNELNMSLTILKLNNLLDNKILNSDINPSTDHTSLVNSVLAQVHLLINANELCCNVQKTNYMVISNRNQIENKNV